MNWINGWLIITRHGLIIFCVSLFCNKLQCWQFKYLSVKQSYASISAFCSSMGARDSPLLVPGGASLAVAQDPRAALSCDIIASHPFRLICSSWSWMLDLGEAPVLVLISWACWRPSPGSLAPAPAPVSASASPPALVPSPCRSVTGRLASGIWLW